MNALERKYLLMPLVEFYTDAGFDVRCTEDGVLIRLKEGVVHLGDVPSILFPDDDHPNAPACVSV